MPSYSALSPVSVAVFTALNVAALTDTATGGVRDDVPQNPTFPFVFYEVQEDDLGGFGSSPHFAEVELRVHVFSVQETLAQAQTIGAKVVELLRNVSLTISGYTHAGKVFYDRTVLLGDELLNGIKVHELVVFFRIAAEST